MAEKQWIYNFGKGCPPPPAEAMDKNLLGGKGFGLCQMASKGLPVPPGFVITTETCVYYRNNGAKMPPGFDKQLLEALNKLETAMGLKLTDAANPLLVSVRSGARVSMPGMMETILDLGLNDDSVKGFASKTNERVAWDSYRRFISMYSNVVDNVKAHYFEEAIKGKRKEEGVEFDLDISEKGLQDLVTQFKSIYKNTMRKDFPQEPMTQLMESIEAVFRSWDCDKAIAYRRFSGYPDEWGTAVNVMAMVFGNRGDNSATGVGFTRDPAQGTRNFYGEFLMNAQGEDVVAGIRTPQPINKIQRQMTSSKLPSLEESMPTVYEELVSVGKILEEHFKDMQDVEFTIEDGKLYMLQTRAGKRTGFAAIKIAYDMLKEKTVSEEDALLMIQPEQLTQLLTPVFDIKDKVAAAQKKMARGLSASPGAACGLAAFTPEKAIEYTKAGVPCVLVREETSPEDFSGMVASSGILTLRGGATSHAAVVARGLGKPCVCGCGDLSAEDGFYLARQKGVKLKEGEYVSIDGSTGEVFFTELRTRPSEIVQVLIEKTKQPNEVACYEQFQTFMDLADKYRRLKVRTNADTPEDAAKARCLGAEGIGLVRTEHMFMEKSRLTDVRRLLFSENEEEKRAAVERLLPYQKDDFVGIFREMDGLTVTIRLLDPPRHEFLPRTEDEKAALAKAMNITKQKIESMGESISEANPMLGHRGCRLGVTEPGLSQMQARAIIEAAIQISKEGKKVMPEIMIPLVATKNELDHQVKLVRKEAQACFDRLGTTIEYKVGTMIELPRAALQADKLAELADFFSFGTNDLTQCTWGISRDDSGHFLPAYIAGVPDPYTGAIMQITDFEPFQQLDFEGVGELMRIARDRGRSTNPRIHLGICGEHGGEAKSVGFCHDLGLDYVSCSPFRVPVARLAAAQAAIRAKKSK